MAHEGAARARVGAHARQGSWLRARVSQTLLSAGDMRTIDAADTPQGFLLVLISGEVATSTDRATRVIPDPMVLLHPGARIDVRAITDLEVLEVQVQAPVDDVPVRRAASVWHENRRYADGLRAMLRQLLDSGDGSPDPAADALREKVLKGVIASVASAPSPSADTTSQS